MLVLCALQGRRSGLRRFGEVGIAARGRSTPGVAFGRPDGPASAVLARLDQARVDGRAALGRARTREAQAVALQRLAGQHLAAADRLHTAFGTAARPLIAGLQDNGRAYAALGRAASDGSPARFEAARQEVRVAEAELGDAVDRIREAGTHDTAANASTSPPGTAVEPARPVISKLLLLSLVLLASAAAGFVASGPIANATSKLWRPTGRPVSRRVRA